MYSNDTAIDARPGYDGRFAEKMSGAIVVEREGELFTVVRVQAKAIEELNSHLRELIKRLEPVMSMEPETVDDPVKGPTPPECELGRVIEVNTIRIDQLIGDVRAILRRLRV